MMGEETMDHATVSDVETLLGGELARGDRALFSVAPVLTHMIANSGHALVSEAVVARLRGMIADLAHQFLRIEAAYQESKDQSQALGVEEADAMAETLANDSALVSFCYAMAMEGHLTERLSQRSAIDPVLSPLLQELIASNDPAKAELAMTAMAAQSGFVQGQRRMEVPLGDLPPALFLRVLKNWQEGASGHVHEVRSRAAKGLKEAYDEGTSRIGLFARLIRGMHAGSMATLDLEHAGLGLFISGLSTLTKQPRELATLACHESQMARLALSLRAAGVEALRIEQQFLTLGRDAGIPKNLSEMPANQARALLAHSAAMTDQSAR